MKGSLKGSQVPRTTKTFTISWPPDMAAKIEELMKEEGRTRSELLREALRRYMDEKPPAGFKPGDRRES
jgi:metal-responsive CopG/Arc/MetJ family transcriptional regulator